MPELKPDQRVLRYCWEADGRVNPSWGSNNIIQVAAG